MSLMMQTFTRFNAFALASLAALALAPVSEAQQSGPPGMVFIQGGRYKIGAEVDNVRELIEEKGVTALVTETPQYEARLDDFYIMPTEVTNEQFARYIKATGDRPPQSWGEKALDDATIAYATEMGKRREEAKKNGEPVPKIEPFDRAEWWKRNWLEAEWAVPKGLEATPVVFIDHEQAEGYARWAGLRLISEEEFQAAARGDTKRYYTWGDTFDAAKLNSLESKKGGPLPVGRYESGCSWVDKTGKVVDERNERNQDDVVGIYDLTGNVWEWTRTPFEKYPKFKAIDVKGTGKKKKEEISYEFDANNRSSVGGAFNAPYFGSRITTRRNSARFQSTDGLGMRCSASTVPGLDIAESVLRADLPPSRRPKDTFYVADQITAIDLWESSDGTANVPGYRVIESYNYLAFIPQEKIPVSSVMLLKDRSLEAPFEIGAFSTTVPLLNPELPAGTYTLSWRAKGEFNEIKPEEPEGEVQEMRTQDGAVQEPVIEPEFPFDPEKDTLIFRNTSGEIVGWVTVEPPTEERLAPGKVALKNISPEDAAKRGTKAGTELKFQVFVQYTKSNKGFRFDIPLLVKGDSVNDTWRH